MDISNGLAELKKDPTITDWLTAYGTIGTLIGAVGIGAISLYLTRRAEQRQSQRQRRSEHMQRLAEIFKLLDDNGHRNARRRNYNLYLEREPGRIDKILNLMGVDITRRDTNIRESKEIVKADFDQAAYLALNEGIPKNDFLDIYGLEVIKSWKVLREDIEHIRTISGDDQYMKNFENLKKAAELHKKTTEDNIKLTKDVTISPVVVKAQRISDTPEYKIQIIFDRPMDVQSLSDKITLKDSQNRVIVLILPYYHSVADVLNILTSNGINVDRYKKEGSIIVVESKKAYYSLTQEFVGIMIMTKMLLRRADKMRKAGVTVVSDMGLFFDMNKIDDLTKFETELLSSIRNMKVKVLCGYNKSNFELLIKHQRQQHLLKAHNKIIISK